MIMYPTSSPGPNKLQTMLAHRTPQHLCKWVCCYQREKQGEIMQVTAKWWRTARLTVKKITQRKSGFCKETEKTASVQAAQTSYTDLVPSLTCAKNKLIPFLFDFRLVEKQGQQGKRRRNSDLDPIMCFIIFKSSSSVPFCTLSARQKSQPHSQFELLLQKQV